MRQYRFSEPGPEGVVRVARPSLIWPFRPTGGASVTEATITLDDKPLPTRYDSALGMVIATPSSALAAGSHRATCTVTLAPRQKPATTTWSFTIVAGALSTLPPPDDWQRSALDAVNAIRTALKLPALRLSDALCAAAVAHCAYLEKNRVFGHFETPGTPGFVGEDPHARAAAFGYTGNLAEDVSSGPSDARTVVQGLFDAPYHRIPFLWPAPLELGTGRVGKHAALEFGGLSGEKLVVSPYDGQNNVPTAWLDQEEPSPLRLHPGAPKRVGYPILLARFGEEKARLHILEATLIGPSGSVACYINTPDTDEELPFGVLLTPKQPLAARTRYQVRVAARTESGTEINKLWSFQTGTATQNATPLDLRTGELKLTGDVVRADGGKKQITLRVTEVELAETGKKTLTKPINLTLQTSTKTAFLALSGATGAVSIKPGMTLSAIVPNANPNKPLPVRVLLLVR